MEIKVHRDTKITIGLTEQEASELLALLNVSRRGVLPIADELNDALIEADVEMSSDARIAIDDHFVEIYST